MSKHSGKIGLYLLLIVALIAGYLYLNEQVSTQGSYTMGQLEKALEEDKVTDAVIHQNREVPTGYVRKVSVFLGIIKSVSYYKLVRNIEAAVIYLYICHTSLRFVKKCTESDACRMSALQDTQQIA